MEFTLVLAQQEEIDQCFEILNSARAFQRQQGFVQWPDGYPPRSAIEEDVHSGKGYVVKVDGQIACYMCIGLDGDPAYPAIKGAWHSDLPYVVIHRLAMAPQFRNKGLSSHVFALIEEFCKVAKISNLRIDTDEKNLRMRYVLEKNGFSYCGTVIQGGGDRFAFDKLLK